MILRCAKCIFAVLMGLQEPWFCRRRQPARQAEMRVGVVIPRGKGAQAETQVATMFPLSSRLAVTAHNAGTQGQTRVTTMTPKRLARHGEATMMTPVRQPRAAHGVHTKRQTPRRLALTTQHACS